MPRTRAPLLLATAVTIALASTAIASTTADQAPGGQAIAHYAGGVRAPGQGAAKKAPHAVLRPTGAQAAEPTMGFDKDGTMFVVGTDGPDADTPAGKVPTKIEWPVMRSDNQGKTFRDVSPFVGPQRRHALVGLDPYLYVDRDTGRVFTVDLQIVACGTVSFSDDKGSSWTDSAACGLADHQTVFAGPPVYSPTVGYPNIVYYCAIDGGLLNGYGTMTSCLKSLTGGLTWTRTGTPAFHDDPNQDGGMQGIKGHCGGSTAHGVVGRDGTIYLPRGWCGQPWLAISHDEGLTWERVQVAHNGVPIDPASQNEEHQASVAVDDEGNLYYGWAGRDRLFYLATSTDGGKTWSEPQRISHPDVKETWGPTLSVGAPGKVAVAYLGSTNAPGGAAPVGSGPGYAAATWNGYITMTTNALSDKPLYYSASVNDPSDPLIKGSCGLVRCQHEYDFIDIVIAPDGTPWTAMVDGYDKDGVRNPTWGLGFVAGLVGGPSLS